MTELDDVVSALRQRALAWMQERDRGTDQSQRLSLDEIGEIIGDRFVTPPQIEALIDSLEAEGITVGEEDGVVIRDLLKTVVLTAGRLKKEGRSHKVHDIAVASGMSVSAVKVALMYAEVLQRPSS